MPDEKPDLTEVLEFYGAEVPTRHGWTAMLCPFHEDRTKSASVNTDLGAFKCFTCDASGDAYALIMFREGIGFRDAVEFGKRFDGDSNGNVRTLRRRGRRLSRGSGSGSGSRRYLPPRGRAGTDGGA